MKLLLLTVLLNTADTVNTCQTINKGGRELNPLLPKSCKNIAIVKGASMLPLLITKGKTRTALMIGISAGSGIGIGISIAKR